MGFPTVGAQREPAGGDLARELEAGLRAQVKESPLLTFAAAGGLGFVLGGGLTIAMMTRLLRTGLRVAFTIRAKEALTDWLSIRQRPENRVKSANMGDTR
jgi:hypothetical protein